MHYIEVENLTFYYDDEPVLEDVSYYVDPGEFVILTGENGAAKSTLIKSTLGLLKPTSGKITVAKKNSAGEKISIGYIPQQVASFNAGFPSTVIELVRSGRFPRNRSGGQKQRISLARVFATDPDLFILDEPTTGMDEQSRNEFYQLLQHSAHEHGKAILMITHDHEDIKTYVDRQIRLVRKEDSKWRCFHMSEESYT